MATEKPEIDGFLAVIEAKIAALKTLAESYRAAFSLGALGQPGDIDVSSLGSIATSRSDGPVDLPQGALLGKSLPAAVKLWLTAVRKKQTVREIAAALRDGGVESTSPNFENVVTGALHRLKATHEVLRFKDGWALAELYPASLRSTLTKDAKPIAKKATARAKEPKQKATSQQTMEHKRVGRPPKGTDKTAIGFNFIAGNSSSGRSFDEIAQAIREEDPECSRDYVRVVLARLQKRQKVERRGDRYFAKDQRSNAA